VFCRFIHPLFPRNKPFKGPLFSYSVPFDVPTLPFRSLRAVVSPNPLSPLRASVLSRLSVFLLVLPGPLSSSHSLYPHHLYTLGLLFYPEHGGRLQSVTTQKTVIFVKSTVFWVLMPCKSERFRRFGGTAQLVTCICLFLSWLTLRS
jgi:hypothetical protein